MTTRAGLRAIVRVQLSDADAWPDSTLNAWINDGIRDYSTFFPRQLSASMACAATQRLYSLAALVGLLGVLMVEYPAAETPPRYLLRRPETGAFVGLPVYDVRGHPPITLVLGEEPSAGENIGLTYSAEHVLPVLDSTVVSVPDHHLEAIKLFAIWQALHQLEMLEAFTPDKTTLLLNMLGINAYRAERAYRSKIKEFQEADSAGGVAGPWVMDGYDRVY